MPSKPGTPETLALARYYLELGLHPFPLGVRSKRPPARFQWSKYQTEAPRLEDLSKWFGAGERNVGLPMGRGRLAVDLDGAEAEEQLAAAGVELPVDAPRSITAHGAHVILAVDEPIPNSVELLAATEKRPDGKPVWQVDIRGDGGYIVAPPSVHETGHVYRWERRLDRAVPAAPGALLALIHQKASRTHEDRAGAAIRRDTRTPAPKWLTEALRGVRKGLRDVTCAKLAGYYLGKRIPKDVVIQTLNAWAALCQPPFPADQVLKCVASVDRKERVATPDPSGGSAFQILGYNHGSYFYLPRDGQQVVDLRAEQHSKLNMLRLAPMQYWESAHADRKGVAWDMAANELIQKCHLAGVYDTTRVRGRGAWWDEDEGAVLHVGDALVVKGHRQPLRVGRYIYEAAAPIEIDTDNPLTSDQANRLAQVAELVSWKRPISARLFAGWCAVAPVCGALRWRPHIWVTASAGSGKSWVIDEIARKLLRTIGLPVQSATTEAGIRQTLGHDARPITFDEIEGSDERAQARIQSVLELARQASSETGAVVVKGSALGVAKTYRIRSCFAFSSIGVGVDKHADATRVSVLELERFPGTKEERAAHFKKLTDLATEVITEEFSRRFIARSIQMAPTIRANAATFATAGAAVIGSQRMGDQVGALLAGAYSLYEDDQITPAKAREFIESQDWTEQQDVQDATDELRCLHRVLEHVVRVQTGKGAAERSVAELIHATEHGKDGHILPDDAEAVLGRVGVRVDREAGDVEYFTVSNSHTAVAEVMAGTPWALGWPRVLRRLAGARPTDGSVRFGAIRTRGVEIPLEVLG